MNMGRAYAAVDTVHPCRGRSRKLAGVRSRRVQPQPQPHTMHPRLLLFTFIAFFVGAAQAHDLWLEPSTHEPAVGQAVGVTVRIGEQFKGDPISLAGAAIGELFVSDAAGRQPVQVLRGRSPALLWRAQRAGTQTLAYRSLPIDISISAEVFNKYLAEEGLEAIAAIRRSRGEADMPANEAYVRSAKALLLVGGEAGGPLGDQPQGLPLELVAREPMTSATQQARFQLLFEGKPIAGVLVVALPESKPNAAQAQRSDADGEVRVRLEPGTRWLLKAVHMQAAPASASPAAPQWLSWWASLTFSLPSARTGR